MRKLVLTIVLATSITIAAPKQANAGGGSNYSSGSAAHVSVVDRIFTGMWMLGVVGAFGILFLPTELRNMKH